MKYYNIASLIILLSIIISSCVPGAGDYNDGPSNLIVDDSLVDELVLQSGVEIPISGTAFKTTQIKVVFNGIEVITKADKDGNWNVKLPAQEIGGPLELSISVNDTTVVFRDIFIKSDVDKKSIISVINNQTKAHLSKDCEAESNTFIKDSSIIVLISRQNWYGYAVGWDKLSQSIKTNISNDPQPSTETFVNTDYKIKIYDRSAWVVYNENSFNANGDFIRKVINVRFLEKVNKKWKIVYLSDVDITSYE